MYLCLQTFNFGSYEALEKAPKTNKRRATKYTLLAYTCRMENFIHPEKNLTAKLPEVMQVIHGCVIYSQKQN